MASDYREINFEEHIEAHLLGSGYRKRLPEEYDKSLCLIPEEVIQYIQSTQPEAFQQLEKQYGADTPRKLLERISPTSSLRSIKKPTTPSACSIPSSS